MIAVSASAVKVFRRDIMACVIGFQSSFRLST